jgi:hypothetical protein
MQEKVMPQIHKARLPHIDRSSEMAWIALHRQEYVGQWVALDGDRLIAHGTDPISFRDTVRSTGVKRPFIVHIHEEPDAFTGGWS